MSGKKERKKNQTNSLGRMTAGKTSLLLPYILLTACFVSLTHHKSMNLSLSAINCNSLNNSGKVKKMQNLKIYGVTALKTDIILLSDIRLSNKNLISCADELSKLFNTNVHGQYDFVYNSSKNSRGTGILIKKNLNFLVHNRWDEPDENALLIQVRLPSGETLSIGSIYGPNQVNQNFFTLIENKLKEWDSTYTILGGDWNCLFSSDQVNVNIDCINMAAAPNVGNTTAMLQMCENCNLTDPFRYIYPDKIDFSFVPRDKSKKNRSRLDYFLVSTNSLRFVQDMHIKPMLQNSLFDHKAICMTMMSTVPTVGPKKFVIRNNLLHIDILQLRVELSVAETYLVHREEAALPQQEAAAKLREVGNIRNQILNLPYPYEYWPLDSFSDADIISRRLKLERLKNSITILDLDRLINLQLSVNGLVFLDTLLNNVRNEIISFQAHFFKWKNANVKTMQRQLEHYKKDYSINQDRIFNLELRLNKILDDDAKRELENFAVFEVLNMEKMTPGFLDIAKKTKSEAKLSDIKDDHGNIFRTDVELNNFIHKYYCDIYDKKPDTAINVEGCIERFLGPEILNEPEVINSKISRELQLMLDRDFDINELDRALDKMKSNTAGGPDGIGVPVYKKFWYLLRSALLEYCKAMQDTGNMSESFLTAAIKLIPKKGDTSQIKNWRPISLLNVGYKIISKAINNRLKKISDTILSRAQKGFTNGKILQECLFNIGEFISHCNQEGIESFVLAIDQAKAFDTVNHAFVFEVYKFFGLPEKFIDLLRITTMGRNARIQLDNGKFSKPIPLKTGFQQGNGPSPLQFNFCEQILLFRLEYEKKIQSVDWHSSIRFLQAAPAGRRQRGEDALAPAPAPAPATAPAAQQAPKGKTEGFADDATVLGRASREAIFAVRDIMIEFASFSGLKANFDKCILMPIGFAGQIPDYFHDAGFAVADNAKILGCTFKNVPDTLAENFTEVIQQIIKIKNFWVRFNLSLPGRLSIAKTLMLSRVSFLGAILDPDPAQLEIIENIIYGFVKGKLNIAASRVPVPVKNGGLGMINIKDFFETIKLGWLKRAINSKDLWSYAIISTGITNQNDFNIKIPVKTNSPILHSIVNAFVNFRSDFLRHNNNIESSFILNNPIFLEIERARPVFAEETADTRRQLQTTTVGSLFENNRLIGKNNLRIRLGINFLDSTYNTFREIARATIKITKSANPDVKPKILHQLLAGIKKGSKQFRKVKNEVHIGNENKAKNSLKKFGSLIQVPIDNSINSFTINQSWSCVAMSNRYREFLFKFFNNLLGINSRVSHFNNNVNEACTFCTIKQIFPSPRETFLHLFYDCNEVQDLLSKFENKYFDDVDLRSRQKKLEFWFLGICDIGDATEKFYIFLLLKSLVLFYVWECKLKKIKMSFASAENFLEFHVKTTTRVSGRCRDCITNSDLKFCRR
jgi:exonuclease III